MVQKIKYTLIKMLSKCIIIRSVPLVEQQFAIVLLVFKWNRAHDLCIMYSSMCFIFEYILKCTIVYCVCDLILVALAHTHICMYKLIALENCVWNCVWSNMSLCVCVLNAISIHNVCFILRSWRYAIGSISNFRVRCICINAQWNGN